MSRTAESTIKGFLFQFNKTIISIAESASESEVTVEGLIEDIDIKSATDDYIAVQCKYHESAENFKDSLIFKPLLQMAESFSKTQTKNISYRIFIHVPNEKIGIRPVSITTLENALTTQDAKLSKIAARVAPAFDKTAFVRAVQLDFGPSLDTLEQHAKDALSALGIKNADVDSLLYPNAISHIAKLSSHKNVLQRKISRVSFAAHLSKITSTVISKWALASKTRDKILAAARKQLQRNLGQNSRERFFYISPPSIFDFETDFVIFVSDFLSKYHSKPTHIKTPLIALDCDVAIVKSLEYRLFKKGIRANTGIIGDVFEASELFKEPISKSANGKITQRDFDLRLCSTTLTEKPLNYRKSDDLFCICEKVPQHIDFSDVNKHHLDVSSLKELGYLLNLRETYE